MPKKAYRCLLFISNTMSCDFSLFIITPKEESVVFAIGGTARWCRKTLGECLGVALCPHGTRSVLHRTKSVVVKTHTLSVCACPYVQCIRFSPAHTMAPFAPALTAVYPCAHAPTVYPFAPA